MRIGSLRHLWLVPLLMTAACAPPQQGEDDSDRSVPLGFAPHPAFGPDAVARRIDLKGSSPHFSRLFLRPDGTLWVWHDTMLEQFSADGVPVRHLTLDQVRAFGADSRAVSGPEDVVMHRSGEFTVVRSRVPSESTSGARPFVELSRRSSAPNVLRTIKLTDPEPSSAGDLLVAADDGSVTATSAEAPEDTSPAWVAGADDGRGGLFALLRHTTGALRLVHLDDEYRVTAGTWVLPRYGLPVGKHPEVKNIHENRVKEPLPSRISVESLAVDGQGRVWVTGTAGAVANELLSRHFGRPVRLTDDGDVFAVRYSASLELEVATALPSPGEQFLPLPVVNASDALGIAARMASPEAGAPNEPKEYGIFFGAVAPDGHTLAASRIELPRDNRSHAIAPCGDAFCIGGDASSGRVDPVTHVDSRKAMVLRVSIAGKVEGTWTMKGPRLGVVLGLASSQDGRLYFQAKTTGPTTPADEEIKFRDLWVGRLPPFSTAR